MMRIICLCLVLALTPLAMARTVVCPGVNQIGQVFVNIGNSYYWQSRMDNTIFRSGIRTDRSEKIDAFLPGASHLSGEQIVCAYKASLLRVNRLTYRTIYLRSQAEQATPLTPAQQQQALDQEQTRQAVSRGAMSNQWVTSAARQNNDQPQNIHPPQQVNGTPLPSYQPGH